MEKFNDEENDLPDYDFPEEVTTQKLVAIIIGVLIIVSLMGVIIWYIIARKNSSNTESHTSSNIDSHTSSSNIESSTSSNIESSTSSKD